MDYKDFAAMMDKATAGEDLRSLFVRQEGQPRFWHDPIPASVFNNAMLALVDACFDDMTSEPCDDSDDGFNKTSSTKEVTVFDDNGRFFFDVSDLDICTDEDPVERLRNAHAYEGYLGITYKVGDTTTFSPGPYDESLGVPVTVHFKG